MLSNEERDLLQSYLSNNSPGAPYYDRVQIILLADDSISPESIALELTLPVQRVRQWLRAYHRQGLQVFPEDLLKPKPPFSPDDPFAVAGKKIMDGLLSTLLALEPELRTNFSIASVHESRKNIRRIRTALRQFAPYYDYLKLNKFRRRFRKAMRRLGASRDNAVFLIKFDQFLESEAVSSGIGASERQQLADLYLYWQRRGAESDQKACDYLAADKYQKLLADFRQVLEPDERDFLVKGEQNSSFKTGRFVPVLIYERLAEVMAYDEPARSADLAQLHPLRIQLKELRYTLEFFEPILGPTAAPAIETVRELLIHLGDLNDARVHLKMLAAMNEEGLRSAVELYSASREDELQRLLAEFPEHWQKINQREWKDNLAKAIAAL